MKSLIGAYDKIGETKPGDLTGDLTKFEEMSADEKCGLAFLRLDSSKFHCLRRPLTRTSALFVPRLRQGDPGARRAHPEDLDARIGPETLCPAKRVPAERFC